MKRLLIQPPLRMAAAASLLLGLAACGGHKKDTAPPTMTTPAPPVAAQTFQDKFGTAFAADFNANMNATPADPSPNDVPALNLSALPTDN